MSKEAARKKVEGLRLPKQMGNDGRARVMVDLTEVRHEPMRSKPHGRRPPGDQLETAPETEDLKTSRLHLGGSRCRGSPGFGCVTAS